MPILLPGRYRSSVLTSLSNLDATAKFTILHNFLLAIDTNLRRFGLFFGPRKLPLG